MDLSTWHGMRTRDPRRLALGGDCWNTPQGPIRPGDGESKASELDVILSRAREIGLRTIDTARATPDSELRIGRATAGQEGWRIATKLSPEVHRDGLDVAETLERADRSLDESRRALGLDTLPILLVQHFRHRHACGGRLWRKLLAEREAGRVGSLGVVATTPEEAWAALEDPDIEVLQVASSLLDQRLHRQGFFPRSRELGRTIHVRNTLLEATDGLEPERLPPFLAELVAPMRTIRSCAEQLGVTTHALHLAFARDLPGTYPIVPCESDAQFERLLADWAAETIEPANVIRLADSLPTINSEALDPSRWPTTEAVGDSAPNQPAATSIATMPA
jgi:aryl-alcohol dehydrogenase-like predicted oxidoreductase